MLPLSPNSFGSVHGSSHSRVITDELGERPGEGAFSHAAIAKYPLIRPSGTFSPEYRGEGTCACCKALLHLTLSQFFSTTWRCPIRTPDKTGTGSRTTLRKCERLPLETVPVPVLSSAKISNKDFSGETYFPVDAVSGSGWIVFGGADW